MIHVKPDDFPGKLQGTFAFGDILLGLSITYHIADIRAPPNLVLTWAGWTIMVGHCLFFLRLSSESCFASKHQFGGRCGTKNRYLSTTIQLGFRKRFVVYEIDDGMVVWEGEI